MMVLNLVAIRYELIIRCRLQTKMFELLVHRQKLVWKADHGQTSCRMMAAELGHGLTLWRTVLEEVDHRGPWTVARSCF